MFTIREGLRVMELGKQNSGRSRGATFWLEIERKELLPKRPAESMRNFFKNNCHFTPEQLVRNLIDTNAKFSHYLRQIPQSSTSNLYKNSFLKHDENQIQDYINTAGSCSI